MSFFVNVLALAVPVFTLQVYDRVVFHAGISTLQGLAMGMVFVLVFDYALRQSRSRIMQRVALKVDVIVGRQVFEKFMSLPMKTLETKPGAHWQSLFRDVDVVRNTLSGASAILIADLPFAVLFLGVIFVIAPAIAWVLLILLPIFAFVAWRSGTVMANANADERETTQNRDSLITEIIAGRTTIKALSLDRAMRPVWEEKHAQNIERAANRGGKADTYTNLGATLTMLTTICLTTIGAIAIIDQRLTMGGLIATNMLSGRLIGPLNQLVNQWRTYSNFKQAVERLGEFFAEASERTESEVKLDKPRGEISVESVDFSYGEDSAKVLDSVTLNIEQGGISALVGRNGSGKTTLLKILQGLYLPNSGRVLLDGADISQFSRSELATWIGYVPQENVLFAGTIRENIAHRIPDAADDEIVRAAKAAGVHQFIIDLPDGYASDIGEAGQRLSGGQRQRIAIARALVGDPPVLLLDEPSSSLDRQAEHELRKTLDEIGKTCTVVIVTHSPILLSSCRDLVALDRGKVALAGPASEILPRLFGASGRSAAAPPPDEEPDAPAPLERRETGTPTGVEPKPRPAEAAAEDAAPMVPPSRHRKPAHPQVEESELNGDGRDVEPSPLLQSLTAASKEKPRRREMDEKSTPKPEPLPESRVPAPSREENAPEPAAKTKLTARRKTDRKQKSKPALQVAPAEGADVPDAVNDELENGFEMSPRPPRGTKPRLVVKQGGRQLTGTNGMGPPPDQPEDEVEE